MQAYVFRGEGRVFAITRDSTGGNLAARYGPWSLFKSIELVRGQPLPGVNVDECWDDLERYGVHVTNAHVRITEDAIR